jgi:hypothetical protein
VAAGALLPRIAATLEVVLLGGAQVGLLRARLAALELEFGLFSSAYDAAEAPPTPAALALLLAADSPKDVSFFLTSPTSALLGPAASASSKGHGPTNHGPTSPSARGDFCTSSDYIGNYFDSMIAASEERFVLPNPETDQALPPALSGSPGYPSPSARGDFSTLSDPIGNCFDSMITASEKPSVMSKLETHQAIPPALSDSPSATCGSSKFLGTAVSPKAASAPRSTSKKKKKKKKKEKEKKKKKKIGRKTELVNTGEIF